MDANWLTSLNEQQRAAATSDGGPLLIIAGAGTGKTNTLAHRVAYLISTGVSPGRILLLTFTRRAAAEMTRRVENIVAGTGGLRGVGERPHRSGAERFTRWPIDCCACTRGRWGWGRTSPSPTGPMPRTCSTKCAARSALDKGDVRFPRKGTCLSIYSRCVNAQEPVERLSSRSFPWCMAYPEQLKQLFRAYVAAKAGAERAGLRRSAALLVSSDAG